MENISEWKNIPTADRVYFLEASPELKTLRERLRVRKNLKVVEAQYAAHVRRSDSRGILSEGVRKTAGLGPVQVTMDYGTFSMMQHLCNMRRVMRVSS